MQEQLLHLWMVLRGEKASFLPSFLGCCLFVEFSGPGGGGAPLHRGGTFGGQRGATSQASGNNWGPCGI